MECLVLSTHFPGDLFNKERNLSAEPKSGRLSGIEPYSFTAEGLSLQLPPVWKEDCAAKRRKRRSTRLWRKACGLCVLVVTLERFLKLSMGLVPKHSMYCILTEIHLWNHPNV